MKSAPVIEVKNLETRFGSTYVHRGLNFSVEPGTIVAVIGGSGCGKSTLLREIIGLLRPSGGEIKLFGVDVWRAPGREMDELRKRFGVLFQNGALFSALTAGENVAVPLVGQMKLDPGLIECLVQVRLGLVGLNPDTAIKMPSELSGGMRKRVSLARALALEPEMLFLDEPTSGLDPIGARAFDRLVQTLSNSLGLTVFMVTHDLDSIQSIAERVIVLENGVILADGTVAEVSQVKHPWIETYFSSRAAA
jgi:phospholipid/cholesterol/gamma-HCH transport system ATP-binding protein